MNAYSRFIVLALLALGVLCDAEAQKFRGVKPQMFGGAMSPRETAAQRSSQLPATLCTFSPGVDTAWVRHHVSEVFGGEDAATAMAIDDSGNVYVSGISEGKDSGYDFATIKYSSSGEMRWEARYEGLNSYLGEVTALAVDHAGNVIITGDANNNYIMIKYDAEGREQWVALYDVSSNDNACGLAVDDAGNVYVAGYSGDLTPSYDYVTMKYSSSGVQRWVARYDGPAHGYDQATAIYVDHARNVFVTGFSTGSDGHHDYATVKYSPDGVEHWVARYSYLGMSDDLAYDLAVDNTGYVYVTGSSHGDCVTIKYDTNSVQRWVASYNGPENGSDSPCGLVVDDSANVYVTGTSRVGPGIFGRSLFVTLKYNAHGTEQWVARYGTSGNSMNYACAIAVDQLNNVLVTGVVERSGIVGNADYATIKYDVNGVEQWVARYDGPKKGARVEDDYPVGLAVDARGDVYVAGTAGGFGGITTVRSRDYAIVKYNSRGVERWIAVYNGPKLDFNHAAALAVDDSDNVYVSGYSTDGSGNSDFVTIKYDAAGAMQWIDRCQEGGQGTRLVVDGSGYVYVTGFGDDSGYVTVKYNTSGTKQWLAQCSRAVVGGSRWPGYPWSLSLAVDNSGNVYVAGGAAITNNNSDYLTIKYNRSGIQQWLVTFDGPANSFDEVEAIAVDDAGNVYVTGKSTGSGTSADIASVCYSSLGEQQWVARYNGSASSWDQGEDIALDPSGNVLVTGRTRSSGSGEDFVTIKYNSSGLLQWIARYNGPMNGWDVATALALDNAGSVYVTGLSNDYGDYATVKYNNSGLEQWVAQYSSQGRSYDYPYDIAVDLSGNVFVTGFSIGLRESPDWTTIKYNSSGVEQWFARYNAPNSTGGEAWAIAVGSAGKLLVTGSSWGNNWSMMTTIKHREVPTTEAPEERAGLEPGEFALFQNYPNPFNPSTIIHYQLPIHSHVTLKVFDILGREVATLVDGIEEPEFKSVQWDASGLASGVYLYRLRAGEYASVKRMVLMK